jgi:putative ATP-dependent endonuclease of the OLD family
MPQAEEIEDEPQAGLETVLCLRLTVGADLEPVWTLVSDRAAALGSERYLAWSDRQDIAPTRIGSFSDVNLSWRRGSVLNKLSKEKADASAILLAAARHARSQFGDTADVQLSEALAKVKKSRTVWALETGRTFTPNWMPTRCPCRPARSPSTMRAGSR